MLRIVLIILLTISSVTLGHVRIRQPANRGSIWRDRHFDAFDPPKNYDDDSNYCGQIPQNETVTSCGLCGDSLDDPMPRANEDGGIYGKGIIVGVFQRGEVIPINVEFTTTHKGYFEMHLCDGLPEQEDCFEGLLFGDLTARFPVINEGQNMWVNTTLQLPNDITCTRCVLRLQYRAGNSWGDCGDGSEGLGCGLQETFRNCIDISIL